MSAKVLSAMARANALITTVESGFLPFLQEKNRILQEHEQRSRAAIARARAGLPPLPCHSEDALARFYSA